MSREERSLDPRGLALVAIANVLPILVSGPLPFTDGPEHVAAIATLGPSFDAGWLYHAVAAALAVVLPDAEVANRWLLAAAGIALPFALHDLLRALGRDERLAIFAGPLFWTRPLGLGLFPFVASLPLVLYGLALAARQAAEPRRGRALGLAVLGLALVYVHVLAFALLALAAGATFVAGRFREAADARPRAPWWLVPGAVAAAAGAVGHARFLDTPYALGPFGLWTSLWADACGVLYGLAFGGVAVGQLLRARRGRTRKLDPRVWTPFACAVVVCLAAPYAAPLVALLAVPLLDPGESAASAWALGLASVVALLVPLVNGVEIRRIDVEEAVEPDALFARTRPGGRLVALNFRTESPRMRLAPWTHAGAYYRLRRGRVTTMVDPCAFRNALDGPIYDYVLVRGHLDPFRDRPPGPAWRVLVHRRDYTLYEKNEDDAWPARAARDEGPCRERIP